MAQVNQLHNTTGPNIELTVRCPYCGLHGSFGGTPADDLIYQPRGEAQNARAGIRVCPNRECKALLFFTGLRGSDAAGIVTYPSAGTRPTLEGVPAEVKACLDEAVECYDCTCYVAAVIMVRKALETLCHDKGATTGMLGQRLKSLRDHVILPERLFDVMTIIQLLGNDAAHVELRDFDDIGESEADVAIECGYTVAEAVYGYAGLINRVDALRATADE